MLEKFPQSFFLQNVEMEKVTSYKQTSQGGTTGNNNLSITKKKTNDK